MNTVTLDNGIDTELDRCITWQFDNATNVVGIINTLRDFFNQSTKTIWDNWRTNVANIDIADDFGLAVWGKLLGCRRPALSVSSVDENAFYVQYTGKLDKINQSHSASGSDVGFYYHNSNYDLIPFEHGYMDYEFGIYRANETSYVYGNIIGTKSLETLTPTEIPFSRLKINGTWTDAENIPGGATMVHPSSSSASMLSTTLYRKILKARFQLLGKNASMKSYCEYLYDVFGGKVTCSDGLHMNLTFQTRSGRTLTDEESALIAQAPDVAFVYPAGVKNSTLQDRVAFGVCDNPQSGWDGSFNDGHISGTIRKFGQTNSTFIWR